MPKAGNLKGFLVNVFWLKSSYHAADKAVLTTGSDPELHPLLIVPCEASSFCSQLSMTLLN